MKRWMRWTIALAVSGGALMAQDVAGTWQGTLQAGRELRIVIKISKPDASGLKAVMHSIDQGGQGISAATVTLQGTTLKFTIPAISGSYEGRLSGDGNTIAGTWTQGNPLALNLTRATPATEWTIPEPPPPPKPMAADANPVFEVATIKPSNPDTPGNQIRVAPPRRFFTTNTTLSDLIRFAYGVHARQITGAPSWVESDRYDVDAKFDREGIPNEKQLKSMVQKLLAERFQLGFHRDKKELSVYAIVPGKGSKLAKSDGDPNGLPGLFFRQLGALNVRNANMTDFANLLQSTVLDRPVVDQSGLTGRFDFTLNWTPDEFQFGGAGRRAAAAAANQADAPPNLFTAIQEQMGFKLDSTKAPAEVLVIDKVEKPSEN